MDLPPDLWYKKHHVLPGGFIPGPGKPKNLDSFLFPGLYHISALQQEGLRVFDVGMHQVIQKRILISMACADALGMAQASGYAGHNSAKGCRRTCKFPGHREPGKGTYYPLCKKPGEGYNVKGSDHGNLSLCTWPVEFSQARYNKDIQDLLQTRTVAQYTALCKLNGIVKPTIFSGVQTAFGVPGIFPLDLMHLIGLNFPMLWLDLIWGTIPVQTGDNHNSWTWAVLMDDDVWEAHGAQVATFWKYLSSEYDQPPQNPAEKLSSGYKAAEYLTYIYEFLPILLHNVLPEPYLDNFYWLVRAVQIFCQWLITQKEIEEGCELIITFLEGFEDLYVQRKPTCIHFVCQCLHTLWHLAHETTTLGTSMLLCPVGYGALDWLSRARHTASL
ncbi:hypothetical protein NP233_g10989 [Leucocoprinus birnbaumii]|uniref:Uncharacterized protein n=1 Tax=Leucocoprinus birnbaumii TaxID=56174 RepID=A0AAD5YLP1_9AGAR|nr:hypothetical protein NP233_g10989 [Leucocoprinus birnbaumii]